MGYKNTVQYKKEVTNDVKDILFKTWSKQMRFFILQKILKQLKHIKRLSNLLMI